MLKIHAEGVPPSVSGLQWPKEAQQCPGRDRCSLEKERAREMLLLLGQQRPQPEDSAAGPVQGWLVAFTLRRSAAALAPQRGKGHTGNSWEKCAQKGVQQFLGFKSGQFCPWGLCYWRQSWASPSTKQGGKSGRNQYTTFKLLSCLLYQALAKHKKQREKLKIHSELYYYKEKSDTTATEVNRKHFTGSPWGRIKTIQSKQFPNNK